MEEKDYKKLYEDVVAIAKDGLKDGLYLSQSAKAVTEFLFPQLKETEDEKARKGLVRFLINFNNGNYSRPTENEIDSWIKWIDKKCKQNPEPKFKAGDWVKSISSGNIFKILSVNDGLYRVLCYDGVEANYPMEVEKDLTHWTIQDAKDGDALFTSSTASHETFIFKSIDEKGKVKCYFAYDSEDGFREGIYHFIGGATNCKPATKEQRDLLFKKMHEAGYEWDSEKKELKKIEQNPTDKVEPKFKVGDWCIDNEDNTIFQITKVLSNLYYYRTNEGKAYSCTRDSIECDAHLWTIQDANDGDVLVTKNGNPFIYDKNRYNNGLAYYYAGLDVNKELTLKSPHHMLAHFGELCSIFPATKEQRDLLFQKMKEAGYEWDAEKKELKKIEQKPIWSEEDEKMRTRCAACLSYHYHDELITKTEYKEAHNWLDSLKDRIQPQPKQEWSEEDEKKRKGLIKGLEDKMGFGWASDPFSREEYIDWLKSIKEKIQRLA